MKTKLSVPTVKELSRKNKLFLLSQALLLAMCLTPAQSTAQSFSPYPAGDDLTTSMGQFQLVLDSRWVKIFDAIMTNSPYANVSATKSGKFRIYKKGGTFTSPTLFDFQTKIGRSDAFVVGSPLEYAGALAGQAPGRTYVRESQIVVRPAWPAQASGSREVHTFLKSMQMTDQLTTRFGLSVRAGMLAPTRPLCAGQVEGGATNDFPANSFFNVYVIVTIPGGGSLPTLELVNVDPLLVKQTGIPTFPPHVVYYHDGTAAVPVYFNTNTIIHDPTTGQDISCPRGTLFGQLTLGGHGISFSSVEVESFQTEFENESGTNSMPLTVNPITNIVIQDFAPDYNASPRSLDGGHFVSGGSFMFTVDNVTPDSTNYLQVADDLASGNWQTIGTYITTTNTSFTFTDPDAQNNPNRFYRLSLLP